MSDEHTPRPRDRGAGGGPRLSAPAIRALPAAAVAVAAAGLVAGLWAWAAGGGSIDLPWAASLDLRLHFRLDGLAALYVLLATGVGLAVFVYSSRYLPLHLEHQSRPAREGAGFYGLLLLFMVSMVGLATAQDLILLFVFWDLTAVSSYFLIAYDRHEGESRWAALMALLVTGVSAVLLLIGALVLHSAHGTFSLPELFERAGPGATTTLAAALIALAGLAKSAQVPLHFWLPRAMTAPTPVSAYLHSAAMVAAGVLLIGRTYPLLADSRLVLDSLLVVGTLSMAVGGLLALTREDLKRVLAYSTISQYGYVVFLYGLGGAVAASAAAFYVLAHGIAKSALFLTAGAVTEATGGRKRLSELGGLARSMPLLAGASAVAVATVVALPLTLGFFADELFFKAALERGGAAVAIAVGAAALTFAYLGRFWIAVFLGHQRAAPRPIPALMVAPVAALAALAALGGVLPGPAAGLAGDAGEASVLGPAAVSVAYHLDLRAENLMALASWGAGSLLLVGAGALRAPLAAFARAGARAGPERIYGETLALLNRLSDAVHDLEVRDLRTRVAAVLVPAGALVLFGVLATPSSGAYAVGSLEGRDLGLILALVLACVGALAATVPRRHLTLALVLAIVGYGLAAVYAFFGAPDVALVAVLVETVFALLFFGVFSLMPADVLEREASLPTRGSRRWRDPLVAVVSGAVAFLLAWAALSRPAAGESVAEEHLRLAGDAHAKDVVTAILADFRALDTLGEVTVVGVALAGVVSLLRRGRLW
jgi:multicomponent Na+:H+ antiporter subunit A